MNNKLSTKIIVSCFLAACLEMYDFAIFGFLMPIINKNYLSFADEQTAAIIGFSFFAIGFIVRPIGSIIFGYMGDVYGRKRALVLSVTCMGIASLAMATLLPYEMIGIWACYIIVFIRIVQGLSVGGEYSGAIIYAVEHFEKKKSGLVGGFIIGGCISGVLLATIIGNIVQSNMVPSYSWRFAFFLGFALSIIGYFVRKNLIETPEFLQLKEVNSKIPLIQGMKNYSKECVGTIAVAAANGINFYFILVFLPGYVNKMLGASVQYFPILTTLILATLSPVFSYWSDFIGRTKTLGVGLLGTAIWGFVGLQLLKLYPSLELALIFFGVHAVIYAAQAGTANVFIVEVFPTKYRYSCAAFCYSIGMGIVGGTSPMIASILVEKQAEYATDLISYYMAIIPLLGYMGMIYASRKINLSSNLNKFLTISN